MTATIWGLPISLPSLAYICLLLPSQADYGGLPMIDSSSLTAHSLDRQRFALISYSLDSVMYYN